MRRYCASFRVPWRFYVSLFHSPLDHFAPFNILNFFLLSRNSCMCVQVRTNFIP